MNPLLLLGLLLAAPPPLSSSNAAETSRSVLEQDRYQFCEKDNLYAPDFDDQLWCEQASSSNFVRCPGYREVCLRQIEGFEWDWQEGTVGEGAEQKDEGERKANAGGGETRGKAKAKSEPKPEPKQVSLPNLGGFAQFLMWLVIGIAIAAVVYAIAKNLVRGKNDAEDPTQPPEPEADPASNAEAAARRAVETDVQRLLARAEQAAARGQHEDAIQDVYAALLRRLEGERLIIIDPWKTNGEYLWELQAKPALRDEVRTVVREIEQVQFGSAAAEAARYQSIRAKIVGIVGRSMLGLVLALGLGSQLACDPDPVGSDTRDTRALAGLGTGPTGARAIGELLLAHDIEAVHRVATIDQLAQTEGAIVLLDGVALTTEEWDRLLHWVEHDKGVLVIATGLEFPRELGISYKPGDERTVLEPAYQYDWYFSNLKLAAPAGDLLSVELRSDAHTDELLVRPAVQQVEEDTNSWAFHEPDPYAVVQWRGKGSRDEQGQVIVFAEADLFMNAALVVGDNGAFLVNLFRSRDIDHVEFVDDMTGSGAQDPFDSMRESKLWAVFLQILLLLALLYAAVGIPFARLRDPDRRRRRSFVEHVETLGQRYAQNRAARHVAALYSAWAMDRLRERLQPAASSGLLPLAQAIAARTGRSEGEIMQLLVQAHELRDHDGSSRGGPHDLQLMRELSTLLDATRGAGRR